jgi:lipopolysaccharide transport system ATP-binding protein
MKPAVRAENLSKCYRVGASAGFGHTAPNLTESVRRSVAAAWGKVRSLADPGRVPADSAFWAVSDVSFDVRPGEAVGVIGRNGAGKSTLFKLLSRITEPTRGRLEIRGRLGSLLEVGTGFHPELTGRENVYMNGSILGMTRREINAKFDRIVDFSEVGPFLDTPVKRYSSGMYVRLAFAVAAHLEPEILVVDEVLAVGDAAFQKRCLDRMTDLARSGKTILFVSHNMQQIPRLCQRAVMLERGRLVDEGPAARIVQTYLDRLLADARTGDLRSKARTGDGRVRFTHAGLLDPDGRPLSVVTAGDDLVVRVDLEAHADLPDADLLVSVQTVYGTRLLTGWTREQGLPVSLARDSHSFECRLRGVTLRPGHTIVLGLAAAAGNGAILDAVDAAAVFEVTADDRTRHLSSAPDLGAVVGPYEWRRVS